MGRFDKFLDYVCGDIISDRERETPGMSFMTI